MEKTHQIPSPQWMMAVSLLDLLNHPLKMAVPYLSCWLMMIVALKVWKMYGKGWMGPGCHRDSAMACRSCNSVKANGIKIKFSLCPLEKGLTGWISKIHHETLIRIFNKALETCRSRCLHKQQSYDFASRLTSFLVIFAFVDIGSGVVRSISPSISEMSSAEKPFVIVVSPVVEVLNCPPVLPCSELPSLDFRRVKIRRAITTIKQRRTPDVTEMISTR